MTKFEKRLSKAIGKCENAIVVGNGFGYLEPLLAICKTVFVISAQPPEIKAKNLVYREGFNRIEHLSDISVMFVDLNQLHTLEMTSPMWTRYYPSIIIEGAEPIGRDLSGVLYKNHYACTDTKENFHIWTKLK